MQIIRITNWVKMLNIGMQNYFYSLVARLIWCKNSVFISSNSDLGLSPVIEVEFDEKKNSAPCYPGCSDI